MHQDWLVCGGSDSYCDAQQHGYMGTSQRAATINAEPPYVPQAGNLLREALGDLQTSEAILAKDHNLTGTSACRLMLS